ncbi:helicase-exonuclease AddAB subunit AddA [Bacillus sp. FJAT-50079]|uniref:helicase-exonuclease AddAB subunit AddA n=1 Tax=Bacillus sp. FJAT-50079 TaxID=2833577 RepID=UPI001BC942A4|nr:helicase-exonuclease AddAB subunit AddA [Bacillus sp. FJAT-50079]MBS4210668.1 helicase-exonuclease AddAB subunit AddA [Bacillus sp. FJAT-50079]
MKTIIPAKPELAHWTDDQWKAIMAKDQDILVAAAAGSGKTAVLVERIIQKILAEEDPLDVDRLLVATFTNAAAAEMRQRIGEALQREIDANPTSSHLRRQLSLLNSASISTLHSFCLEVVRKHYYLIDIDPGFRIADQTEADLLRDEVLNDLFEEEYGKEKNDRFYQLVDTFTSDRNDDALFGLVLKLYDFSRSHPEPNAWLDQLVAMYDVTEGTNVEELPFIEALIFDVKLQLTGAKGLLQEALAMSKQPGGPAPRAVNYLEDLQVIAGMEQAAEKGWNELYQVFNQGWKFGRAKTCRGDEFDNELVKEADELRKTAKTMLDKLTKELFFRSPQTFLKDMGKMQPIFFTLAEMVKLFAQQFALKKAEKGLVDFSDLEHLCLEILTEKEDLDERVPSEIATQYRNQFKEVLVDEYQDVNMVQETIIRLVSAEGEYDGNLFMVGDVKQSIYRFRLAEPNLFLNKYVRFSQEGKDTGLRIDLARNFRSRAEVLAGTNFLFKQIMGKTVGEIEYSHDAELVKGSGYSEAEQFPIEVAIIDMNDESSEGSNDTEEVVEGFDAVELEQSKLEARFIAGKIRAMIDEQKLVTDLKKGIEQPIRYRDIVILVRSMTWTPDIIEECKHLGIPVYADLSTGYFDATEVTIMMSLLQIIDNPDQDIPLASVLRSPIVGLTEEELAYIRLQSKGSYYAATKAFLNGADHRDYEQTKKKLTQLFQHFHEWRSLAREGALSELIWQLYRDTGFYEFVGGLPGGKQRQANLRALYDRARQYEETSFRGLFRFLRFIERMRERGSDLGTARALGEQEDVVRIMTIHASKGLEFPVVFTAGIARKFNMMDIHSSYLFDKDYGFASKYIDAEKRISYPSLPQLALKRKKKMELLAEEMRVLYVAMTRAKEKLYLISSVKNVEKELKKWRQATRYDDWLLPDYERAKATSYIDWIGLALARHRDIEPIFGEQSLHGGLSDVTNHPSQWAITIVPRATLAYEQQKTIDEQIDWQEIVENGEQSVHKSPFQQEIHARLTWEYDHSIATKRMSKQSVSELKRLAEARDEMSDTQLIKRKAIFDRPRFMREKKALTPAEKGTAMHAVMQHISLDKIPTEKEVNELLGELVRKELMTEEQIEAVSAMQIVQFFQGGLGERMLQAKKVSREIPFTIGIPANEVYPDWDGLDEKVLVQGIIDCIIEDQNGVILLDYKTDAIEGVFPGGFAEAIPVLEKRYRVQLSFYKRAIEEILKKPVRHTYVYFFDGGEYLEI